MAKATSDFIDRLVERMDRLDPNSIQGYMLKLVREKGVLETIFRTIREGVIIISRDLTIEYVNKAAMLFLGLPETILDDPSQKINRHLRDLDWGRIMSQDPDEWERASRQEIEVFYPRYRALLFYVLPYKNELDPENKLGMAIIILHDVTELRDRTKSQIETERLNALSMLAASVAHEIGNPLNSLNIHLQLLQRTFRNLPDGEAADDAREMLGICTGEVKRLDQIITTFLKAVRPSAIELEPVRLEQLVSESLQVLEPEIKDRGVEVNCQWEEQAPQISGDATQLKQVCYNLIKNAVQSMGVGGRMDIILKRDEDYLRLAFCDNGKGISPEQISNIFNPYYTTRESGTGLGLVVVERIIRDHGAELGIESEPGCGTVVTISFPLKDRRTRLLEAPDDSLRVEALELDQEN